MLRSLLRPTQRKVGLISLPTRSQQQRQPSQQLLLQKFASGHVKIDPKSPHVLKHPVAWSPTR